VEDQVGLAEIMKGKEEQNPSQMEENPPPGELDHDGIEIESLIIPELVKLHDKMIQKKTTDQE
jgi:phosphopantothenate-cysteine ligase